VFGLLAIFFLKKIKKKFSQDLKTREEQAKKGFLEPVLTRFNYEEMSVEGRRTAKKRKTRQTKLRTPGRGAVRN
jgi:hypothetical protein